MPGRRLALPLRAPRTAGRGGVTGGWPRQAGGLAHRGTGGGGGPAAGHQDLRGPAAVRRTGSPSSGRALRRAGPPAAVRTVRRVGPGAVFASCLPGRAGGGGARGPLRGRRGDRPAHHQRVPDHQVGRRHRLSAARPSTVSSAEESWRADDEKSWKAVEVITGNSPSRKPGASCSGRSVCHPCQFPGVRWRPQAYGGLLLPPSQLPDGFVPGRRSAAGQLPVSCRSAAGRPPVGCDRGQPAGGDGAHEIGLTTDGHMVSGDARGPGRPSPDEEAG